VNDPRRPGPASALLLAASPLAVLGLTPERLRRLPPPQATVARVAAATVLVAAAVAWAVRNSPTGGS
jgi:hypothetical protein